jgi:hypothetical protein
MVMSKISDKSNKELMEYHESLKRDFDMVKRELILKTKHMEKIKSEYLKVHEELKMRYGIQ